MLMLPGETSIIQEILMVNDGLVNWPIDTRMELIDVFTDDLSLTKVIHLGAEVPCNSQVKINFKIEVKERAQSSISQQ